MLFLKNLTLKLRTYLRHGENWFPYWFRMLYQKIRGIEYPHHRDFLLQILPVNSIGAEIGTHRGEFARQILHIVKPKKLHLIDPWEFQKEYENSLFGGFRGGSQKNMQLRFNRVKKIFKRQIDDGEVIINRGYSTEVLREFPDDYLDWVYIDGNHSYEVVRSDLELSYKKTKPGGLITGDDYSDQRWYKDGVIRAVDEFVNAGKAIKILIKDEQYILEKTAY